MSILKKVLAFGLLVSSLCLRTYAMGDDPTFSRENLLLIFGQHPSVNLKVETMESFEPIGSPRSKCLFFQFRNSMDSSNPPNAIWSVDLALGDHYKNDQIQFKLTKVMEKLIYSKIRLETEMLTNPTNSSHRSIIDCISSCFQSTIQHEGVPNKVKDRILTITQPFIAQ